MVSSYFYAQASASCCDDMVSVQFRGGNSFDYIFLGDKNGKLSIQLDRLNSNIFLIYPGFWLIKALLKSYLF